MSKIIAQYILTVMDNGQISTVQIPLPVSEGNDDETEALSSSSIMMDVGVSLYKEEPDLPKGFEDFDDIDISQISLDPEVTHVEEIDLAGTSARIKQLILVLHYVKELTDEDKSLDADDAVKKAIRKVAEKTDVSYTTVADKVCRQMGLTMAELKSMIARFYSKQDPALKEVAMKNIGQWSRTIDEEVIHAYFANPGAQILIGENKI